MEKKPSNHVSLENSGSLIRFLPNIISEIEYGKDWGDAQLAHALDLGRSTIAAWRLGSIPDQISTPLMLQFRRLRREVQGKIALKGIDGRDIQCVCNLSKVYLPNYRRDAEKKCRDVLAQPFSQETDSVHLDFRVRPAYLPEGVDYLVFSDKGVSHRLFLILTNYNLSETSQSEISSSIIFRTIRNAIEADFIPEVYLPRFCSFMPQNKRATRNLPPEHHQSSELDHSVSPAPVPEEDVGMVLKDIRYGIGYSTLVLAQRLGVAQSTLSRWLNGKVVPSDLDALCRLNQFWISAAPYLRTKFINPFNLELLAEETTHSRVNISTAFEILRTTIGRVNIDIPIPGPHLDIHIRGAALHELVKATCLKSRTSPNLYVILVNQTSLSNLQQYRAAFDEIEAHII